MSDVFQIFSTPILKKKLNLDLKILNKTIKTIQKKNKNINKTNVGGYQSPELDYKNIKEFKSLINDILSESHNFAANILVYKKKLKINNIWFNINNYKDFNKSHTHPRSLISGVFYVKTPLVDSDDYEQSKLKGMLTFENPQEDIEHYYPWAHRGGQNAFVTDEFSFPPFDNGLFLFPSWVKHYVNPNMSKEERISIAFNVSPV
tara:strand:+ start:2775 stop:3386 length:612 start_codon:yes stop_codon:yes gene_type:complete